MTGYDIMPSFVEYEGSVGKGERQLSAFPGKAPRPNQHRRQGKLRPTATSTGPLTSWGLDNDSDKTGDSTLPNCYSRLKSDFTVVREKDVWRLIEAKHEVEDKYRGKKWGLIAKGGGGGGVRRRVRV